MINELVLVQPILIRNDERILKWYRVEHDLAVAVQDTDPLNGLLERILQYSSGRGKHDLDGVASIHEALIMR